MTLLDRINKVINTDAFEASLASNGLSVIDFQLGWPDARGDFDKLPWEYRDAVLAGEKELEGKK
jgi:hypothetical protein